MLQGCVEETKWGLKEVRSLHASVGSKPLTEGFLSSPLSLAYPEVWGEALTTPLVAK